MVNYRAQLPVLLHAHLVQPLQCLWLFVFVVFAHLSVVMLAVSVLTMLEPMMEIDPNVTLALIQTQIVRVYFLTAQIYALD